MEIAAAALIGFVLDSVFGDPRCIKHPVMFIGNLISFLEKVLRKIFPKTKAGEIAGGAVLNILVLATSFAVPYGILYLAKILSPILAFCLETFWCYQIFAAKSLKTESMRVYNCIKAGNLEESRKYLSWIVGRDTKDLSFEQIEKAVVETVAENTSDGVIAPMIFMLIGGAPLGFLYKGVNTLDSMVGYKNDRYINFGKVSAIVDDIFNFIPARITGISMILGAGLVGFDMKGAFRIFRRDRHNHASPNSAQCESACAGALGVELAGDAYYFGKLYKKKTIGDRKREITADDIPGAVKLMYAATLICLCLFVAVRVITVTFI